MTEFLNQCVDHNTSGKKSLWTVSLTEQKREVVFFFTSLVYPEFKESFRFFVVPCL